MSPSISSLSLSTVAVPPSPPTISDADGQEVPSRQVGPYEIDDDLVLDCHVRGGMCYVGIGCRR